MAEKIETKVVAASTVATVVGVLLALANWVTDSGLLGSLPAWVQAAVITVGPGLATLYAGWQAKHTPRPPASSGTGSNIPQI